MANLGQKDGIYHIRFRWQGKECKRSLKTRSKVDAEAARATVEQTIHRLVIGLLQIPAGVDPGDFIFSGGMPENLECPVHRRQSPCRSSCAALSRSGTVSTRPGCRGSSP